MYKLQAEKSETETNRCRQEVMQIKEHSLKIETNQNKGTDLIQDRFETQKERIEQKHRENISVMEGKLQNKEHDLYKMEQLLLKLNHKIDEAQASREEFKIESDMSKIREIRLEEKTNYLKLQYDEMLSSTKSL